MSKGTFYQIIARFSFLLSSYLIHISMAYFLADPKDYGNLGVILSLITVARVFLSTGLPQTASRFIALHEQHEGAIFWKSFQIQAVCSLAILVIYVGGIPLWTSILNDKSLGNYILLSSFLIPGMALFQISLAYLNGKRFFGLQALYIGLYSVTRFILAMFFVLLGMKIMGVLLGLISAVFLNLTIMKFKLKFPKVSGTYDARELVRFSLPIIIFSVGVSLLVNCDILILKHVFPEQPIIGYYTGAMNLGKLPYFVLYAYSVTLLPMVSKALGGQEMKQLKVLIRKNISSLIVISICSTLLVAGTAGTLLDFVYPADYRSAGEALVLLFASMCGLALVHALASLITAKGKPHIAMIIIILCIPVQIGAGLWLAPRFGMIGMAAANLAAVFTGLILAAFFVFHFFGLFVNVRLILKAVISSLVMYFVLISFSGYPVIVLPFIYLAGLSIFIGVMFVLRAFSKDDVAIILSKVYKT
jgi:O-antigen/teichoic acid export membrane protein